MARILFLAHRIPYPPNKGDKIRSWHFLEYLAEHHEVHLGFHVDAAPDLAHVDFLKSKVASLCHVFTSKRKQKVLALRGLVDGRALTLAAYPLQPLRDYCQNLLANGGIDLIFLYSAATAPVVMDIAGQVPVITDLVDVDSAKWAAYANSATWPMSWLYAREARLLSQYEQWLAAASQNTLLVSDAEATLFRSGLAADMAANVVAISNGVDLVRFDPARYGNAASDGNNVIFTGAMDYAPNVEAVTWFATEVWPLIYSRNPDARFRIAGGPEQASVRRLEAIAGIEVLGYVEDMAASIAAANIVVAPLLTARGIQNKVLEGMAMAKPVVATSAAHEGILAQNGTDLLEADGAEAFAQSVLSLLEDGKRREQLGLAARAFVEQNHSWQQSHAALARLIGALVVPGNPGDEAE